MPYTRVKICGITRPEDAALAAELGADAIGLNFVKGPRKIDLPTAKSIMGNTEQIPFPPVIVALCAVPGSESPISLTAGEVGEQTNINRFQVYGRSQMLLLNDDESPAYWMVCPINNRDSLAELAVQLHVEKLHPQALLLDTASKSGQLGGTGQSFNWHWIAEARDAGELQNLPPIILAGGLTPDNVADAIRIAKPYAVDVSSGVEVPGKPGIKDPIKLRDFIQAAKSAV